MTCELSRELSRQYYNRMLQDKFHKYFDLDIYSSREYIAMLAHIRYRQKQPEIKRRARITDEEKKAYQKEYRTKYKYKYKQHYKEYYQRNRDKILNRQHKRTKTYKLKQELANCKALVDDFDNIDMILDF